MTVMIVAGKDYFLFRDLAPNLRAFTERCSHVEEECDGGAIRLYFPADAALAAHRVAEAIPSLYRHLLALGSDRHLEVYCGGQRVQRAKRVAESEEMSSLWRRSDA